MKSTKFCSAGLALLLCLIPVSAGGPHHTRMVEAKPVAMHGLEFIAAVEAEWVCYNPPIGEDPIQVQLFIRNTTREPMLFPTFDTFGISLKDSHGKEIKPTGGRDSAYRTKSVIIEAGGRYCLSRKAELSWNPDGKTRSFAHYDGTGTVVHYGPLATGSYTLSFWCARSEDKPVLDEDAKIATWDGKLVTKEVAFKIVDP
ncbi:MAG: hypothetical protein NTY53_18950 [Kiritimatiellaeota bacterium]|nr:hypothetical protein [Kiritimatiellota bacterium]